MILAVYGHEYQDSWLPTLERLFSRLADRGFALVFEDRFMAYLAGHGISLPEGSRAVAHPDDCGMPMLALSLGGDGTVLRTVEWIGKRPIPVLGVNTGHLGYLASCSADHADRIAELIASGSLVAEKRHALMLEAEDIPEDVYPFALNEVAVMRGDTSAMLKSKVNIDNVFLGRFEGDGVIVATPTGSTGYNLSVGGPILHPSLDCHIISPIAPHSLTLRPIVISGTSQIEVESQCRSGSYRVSLDGRSFLMPSGSHIIVKRSPWPVTLLRLPGDHFAETLRSKLLWGGTPNR